MKITSEFVRRTYYSQELKHQICKDHIDNGLSLRQCVEKYNLSCHSLVHDWLRKLGYIAGYDRRSRSPPWFVSPRTIRFNHDQT
jgi:transposase-like protein